MPNNSCSQRLQACSLTYVASFDSMHSEYRWSVRKHYYAPARMKQAIHMMVMLRSIEHLSVVSLLPNEILIEIFEALDVNSFLGELIPSSSARDGGDHSVLQSHQQYAAM